MRRIRLLAVLAIAMVAGLLVTGCKGPMDLTPDAEPAAHWVLEPEVFTIWAGPNYNVGNVTVWNTPETLYLKYDMSGSWWLEKTRAHVALKLKDIPQKNRVPQTTKFEFKNVWQPRVKTCTYAIPVRTGWDVDVNLYIATYSVVVKVNSRGNVTQREDGWAGPYFFSDGAVLCHGPRYIKYKFKDVYKDLDLPPTDDPCSMAVFRDVNVPPGYYAKGRFRVALSGVPPGYDVWDMPPFQILPRAVERAPR